MLLDVWEEAQLKELVKHIEYHAPCQAISSNGNKCCDTKGTHDCEHHHPLKESFLEWYIRSVKSYFRGERPKPKQEIWKGNFFGHTDINPKKIWDIALDNLPQQKNNVGNEFAKLFEKLKSMQIEEHDRLFCCLCLKLSNVCTPCCCSHYCENCFKNYFNGNCVFCSTPLPVVYYIQIYYGIWKDKHYLQLPSVKKRKETYDLFGKSIVLIKLTANFKFVCENMVLGGKTILESYLAVVNRLLIRSGFVDWQRRETLHFYLSKMDRASTINVDNIIHGNQQPTKKKKKNFS